MTTPAGAPGLDRPLDSDGGSRNWMGLAATITGALGLSVVAIVLGHLGLTAVKTGTANNRTFALAGTILGYIGLAATGALAAWYILILAPTYDTELNDVKAQVDAAAVGREIGLHSTTSGALPTVVQTADGYIVENVTVPAALTVERTLTFVGNSITDWCLLLVFEGGSVDAYSYTSSDGLAERTACVVPVPSPSPEPTTSPGATPTPPA